MSPGCEAASERTPDTPAPRPRVLLAEDHEAVAAQLRKLLEIECDVVGVVTDGHSLLLAADALFPDIVVSDLTMPGVDGLTAARTILSRHPDMRIVFVTVHDEPAMVRKAFLLGALGYVLKADAGDELLPAVRAAWGKRRHLSTNIRTRLT
jgi:DNA-binding NarL/FixJ family response regulator